MSHGKYLVQRMPTPDSDILALSASMPARDADAAMPGLSSAAVLQLWDANRPHAQPMPGAYEWWRMEAINAQGDGVVLLLFNGLPFHPDYLTHVHRSRRKLRKTARVPANVQASELDDLKQPE